MSIRNRAKLKKVTRKRVRIELKCATDSEFDGRIKADHARGINNFFEGYERTAAYPAHYTTGLGDRIELYDLGSAYYIGAIYPDGAPMLWPIGWSEGKRYLKDSDYKHEPTYSSVLLSNRKLRNLAKLPPIIKKAKNKRAKLIITQITKRKILKKRKRMVLHD